MFDLVASGVSHLRAGAEQFRTRIANCHITTYALWEMEKEKEKEKKIKVMNFYILKTICHVASLPAILIMLWPKIQKPNLIEN